MKNLKSILKKWLIIKRFVHIKSSEDYNSERLNQINRSNNDLPMFI
ncbi:hypothetical protein [Flavivirga spongiicola]|uniref:Uncharacterized protein n=1 Tax=Flavivirga spongiicola TaxID=421621 RepID=A0ABU7XVU7_9FLAO|nr:hypothetical protein [Flavivirga sp. MEBiC05379]MDO5979560.1 hypothetical protein [Flavivirga sp. MEBiC05379]